jgi:hypothetical protein
MPITVKWDTPLPDTIYYHFSGRWTWDDYFRAFAEECQLAASISPRQYDVLGDLLHGSVIPRGPGIRHVINTYKMSPKNMGLVIAVTNNTIVRAVTQLLVTIQPDMAASFQVTQTLDEARRILTQRRQEHTNVG